MNSPVLDGLLQFIAQTKTDPGLTLCCRHGCYGDTNPEKDNRELLLTNMFRSRELEETVPGDRSCRRWCEAGIAIAGGLRFPDN